MSFYYSATRVGCCGYTVDFTDSPHSIFGWVTSEEECKEFERRAQKQINLIDTEKTPRLPVTWTFKVPGVDRWLVSYQAPSGGSVSYKNIIGGKRKLTYDKGRDFFFIETELTCPHPLAPYQHSEMEDMVFLNQITAFGTDVSQFTRRLATVNEKLPYITVLHYQGSPGTQEIIKHIRNNFNVLKEVNWHNPFYGWNNDDPKVDGHHLLTVIFERKA